MADGPTVVNTGGGGTTAVAIIVALVALVVLLFMFGVIDLNGAGGSDIDVKIDAPAVEAPAAPAARRRPLRRRLLRPTAADFTRRFNGPFNGGGKQSPSVYFLHTGGLCIEAGHVSNEVSPRQMDRASGYEADFVQSETWETQNEKRTNSFDGNRPASRLLSNGKGRRHWRPGRRGGRSGSSVPRQYRRRRAGGRRCRCGCRCADRRGKRAGTLLLSRQKWAQIHRPVPRRVLRRNERPGVRPDRSHSFGRPQRKPRILLDLINRSPGRRRDRR